MSTKPKPAPSRPRTPYTERDRALNRIRRKLERWELQHLRDHAAHLAARVDELESTVAALRDALTGAEDRAEWWREQLLNVQDDLRDDLCLGLTRDGAVGLVRAEARQGAAA